MERGRLRLKIGDVLVVLITLLLAAGAFAVFHWTRPDTQTQALILSDGETVARVASRATGYGCCTRTARTRSACAAAKSGRRGRPSSACPTGSW